MWRPLTQREIDNYKSGYTDEIKKAKDSWKKELARLFSVEYSKKGYKPEVAGHLDHVLEEYIEKNGSVLTQTKVIGILDRMLEDDSIVVGASGSLPGDAHAGWP